MTHTPETIIQRVEEARRRLSQYQTRQQVVANDTVIDINSREVYKEKKIKRDKDLSRLSEDQEALTPSSLEETPLKSQEAFVNMIAPATTSSRVTGISVQHVKTQQGIKLNVAIQTEQDAAEGMYVELTAELKRHSRLRELKRYSGDDAYFETIYVETIETLKALTPQQGRSVALGRMHVRGARGHWFANMMAVGQLTTEGILHQVLLHINGEEFEIKLDGVLSPAQEKLYYNTGIWGSLTRYHQAPRLETAQRKPFK